MFFSIITILSLNNIAQISSGNHYKYWYYRDRLTYFVMPGLNRGQSIVSDIRNRDVASNPDGDQNWTSGDEIYYYSSISFGQEWTQMGNYIGMLATEYRLLYNNGQFSDAANTLVELNFALDALIRMDECEDEVPWNQTEAFDGFFVREDAPPVMNNSMEEYFNEGLVPPVNIADFLTSGYYGKPAWIDPTKVECLMQYENPQGYYYSHRDPLHPSITEYNLQGDEYMHYFKNQKFISQDEMLGVLIGLTLVSKLVDDYSTNYKARLIGSTLIYNFANCPNCDDYVFIQWSDLIAGGDPFSGFNAVYPNWSRCFPDGDWMGNNNGGTGQSFAFPLSKLYTTFFGIPSNIQNISSNSPTYASVYYSGLMMVKDYGDRSSRSLYSRAVSLSNKGIFGVFNLLSELSEGGYDWDEFYSLLWATLYDKDLTKKEFDFDHLVYLLDVAPCGGPYAYATGQSFSDEWSCGNRWSGDYGGHHGSATNSGEGWVVGNFNGIDYMLLYNLACLAFPHGFEYNGQTYRFPYYVNTIDRHDIHAIYPYTYVYSMQGAHMDPLGSTIHPEEIRAISTIESSMIVTTTCDVVYTKPQYANNSYEIDGIGDVTLIAGESIRLTDGFRVDAGAHFLAKIESYSCNGLSYKNMNAPPWSENYRASFYDTLISVPRDQRAPIVYNDDDYGYEDYDEPLWDDYYYQYPDTSTTPELPMSAYLNPNPCASRTVLQIVPGSDVFVKIELYDISGQKREELYEGNTGTSAFDLDIDMSTYSQGVYILRIIGDGAVKTIKLMKN